jgi:vitamin B12 transporter
MKKTFLMIMVVSGVNGNVMYSQTDSLRHYRMEETIVTATRSEENTARVARNVTVITEKEIRNSVSNNVGELLGQQEGIFMVGSKQTPGSIQNIFMRGANSNHTVIMIDGMRISDPSSVDNALDLSELSLANIERIEIVRGAHSTLYGSSAIGGVINIITKKTNPYGFNANTDLQRGYFGKGTSLFDQSAYANYTFRSGIYANAEILHSKVNGINAAIDTVTRPGAYKNFDNDGFAKLDWMGKIGYKDERWNIFTSYKNVNQQSDLDAGAFVDDPNYTINFRRSLSGYGAVYKWNDQLNFSFLGDYSSARRKAINDSNRIDAIGHSDHSYFRGDYAGTVSNNELQANLRWEGIAFVSGIGRYKETMTASTFTLYTDPSFYYANATNLDTLRIHAVMVDAYVHADMPGDLIHQSLRRFNLGLGWRMNHHSTYGNNYTYEVNPSYQLTENSLVFASYATGFNAPSLYRLFTPDTYYTSNIQRGNRNLKPETSLSYELGYKQALNEIRFSFSLFYTKVRNYIDFVYLWDKNIPVDSLGTSFLRDDYRGDTYLNIGDQINKGVDAGVSGRINSKLIFFGNATYVRGQLNYDPSLIDIGKTQGNHVQLYSNGLFLNHGIRSSKLIRRPNTGNLGLTYTLTKALDLSGVAQYTGRRRDVFYDQTLGPFGALSAAPLKSYWTFDVSAKYDVKKQWSLQLKVQNLFNEKTTEIRGFRNRGRGYLLNLRYLL